MLPAHKRGFQRIEQSLKSYDIVKTGRRYPKAMAIWQPFWLHFSNFWELKHIFFRIEIKLVLLSSTRKKSKRDKKWAIFLSIGHAHSIPWGVSIWTRFGLQFAFILWDGFALFGPLGTLWDRQSRTSPLFASFTCSSRSGSKIVKPLAESCSDPDTSDKTRLPRSVASSNQKKSTHKRAPT